LKKQDEQLEIEKIKYEQYDECKRISENELRKSVTPAASGRLQQNSHKKVLTHLPTLPNPKVFTPPLHFPTRR
jgi:hypothetical protein